MQYVSVEISLVAILPALLLCWYIYEKDRVEKEPFGLLSLLFAAGAVGFIPAFFAERGLTQVVDSLFAAHLSVSVEGAVLFDSVGAQLGHAALFGFVAVALVENGIKWLLLILLTHKSRHFNSLFDGLIYACFVSLGFAAMENVCYAWLNGWDTLWLRLITSLPCHLLIGVLMGYAYTLWHTVRNAQLVERRLVQQNLLPAAKVRGAAWLLAASFLAPSLTQGLYILSGSFHSSLIDVLFYVAIGMLFVGCFVGIHVLSDKDNTDEKTSFILVLRRHPEINVDALHAAIDEEVSQ